MFQNTLKQVFNKNLNTTQRSTMYSMLSRAPQSIKTRQLSASEATTQISLHFTTTVANGHRTSQLITDGEKTTAFSNNVNVLKDKKRPEKRNHTEKIADKSIGSLAQKMLRMLKKDSDKHIVRQTSGGSANTISNSSLQDMDEIDFSSSDLVKYMEEVNGDLTS